MKLKYSLLINGFFTLCFLFPVKREFPDCGKQRRKGILWKIHSKLAKCWCWPWLTWEQKRKIMKSCGECGKLGKGFSLERCRLMDPLGQQKFPLFEEENLKFPHPNSIILGVDSIQIHGKFPMETLLLMEMKLNIQTFFQKAHFQWCLDCIFLQESIQKAQNSWGFAQIWSSREEENFGMVKFPFLGNLCFGMASDKKKTVRIEISNPSRAWFLWGDIQTQFQVEKRWGKNCSPSPSLIPIQVQAVGRRGRSGCLGIIKHSQTSIIPSPLPDPWSSNSAPTAAFLDLLPALQDWQTPGMEMRLGRANLGQEKREDAGIRPWMPEVFPPALGPGGIFHPIPQSWSGGSHSCWTRLLWLFLPTFPTKPALIHAIIPDPFPSFPPF